jgi:hypothetical protein
MPTNQVQLRRGTSTQVNAMTPAEGEVVIDMTNDRACVGDGLRQGGFAVPNFSDIQENAFGYAATSGTANAIVLTLTPALLSYVEGVEIDFKATLDNTGATNVNVNGLGDISLRNQDVSLLSGGEIVAGRNYKITYNGTQFVISGGGGGGGSFGTVSAGSSPLNQRVSNYSAINATWTTASATYRMPYSGVVRLNMRITSTLASLGEGRWLKNGVVISGTTHQASAGATTSYTDDEPVTAGDVFQFAYRGSGASSGANNPSFSNIYLSSAEYLPSIVVF